MRPSRHAQSGFTLTETLVALFILAILAVAGGNLLLRATDAGKQVRDREEMTRTLDVAQAYLRDDLEAASLRAAETAEGRGGVQLMTGGETSRTNALLTFVRNGWINPENADARSGLQAISYTLSDDGELIREASLRPDPTPSTPVARRVLLTGVEAVDLVFWRGGEPSVYWEGTPEPPANVLPDMIEMRIRFKNEETLNIASLVGGLPS
ncbi:type II secretion system minor pseudopilin GspJ [Henriciella litoralis]|uniref:type II secretion system minor pseudopilin GspJ n=1 Tax=Henriciella litoralis TaxID=568102 RepID=UPI0009FBCB4E|nr:type II secretion system minor pseudopilin GspJ [Henriciella litoralis]